MIQKEIGLRLKEARNAAGFTQKQVAEKLGMLQPAYARYESGALELDYAKLIFLCNLYETSSDYILGIKQK
jgi:transcriptional regulator with XRE-family HTH domain